MYTTRKHGKRGLRHADGEQSWSELARMAARMLGFTVVLKTAAGASLLWIGPLVLLAEFGVLRNVRGIVDLVGEEVRFRLRRKLRASR